MSAVSVYTSQKRMLSKFRSNMRATLLPLNHQGHASQCSFIFSKNYSNIHTPKLKYTRGQLPLEGPPANEPRRVRNGRDRRGRVAWVRNVRYGAEAANQTIPVSTWPSPSAAAKFHRHGARRHVRVVPRPPNLPISMRAHGPRTYAPVPLFMRFPARADLAAAVSPLPSFPAV
jgi:hypothetical protein